MATKVVSAHDQTGQAVLETVILLPAFFIVVAVLYKVNIAAQVSINYVQAARSQLFTFLENSSEYPRLAYRHTAYNPTLALGKNGYNQLLLGVSSKEGVQESDLGDSTEIFPIPEEVSILRKGATKKGNDGVGEVKERSELRIRTTVAICTPINSIKNAQGTYDDFNSLTALRIASLRWPFGQETCYYGEPR